MTIANLVTVSLCLLSASAAPIASVTGSSVSGPPGFALEFLWMPSSIPFGPDEIALPLVPVSPALEGTSVTFDSTSPGFDAFVAKVTDGDNNFIDVRYLGAPSPRTEDFFFWGPPGGVVPDLHGSTINSIEISLDDVNFHSFPALGLDIGDVTWTVKFFGVGPSAATPDSGSALLLLSPVLGVLALLKRPPSRR